MKALTQKDTEYGTIVQMFNEKFDVNGKRAEYAMRPEWLQTLDVTGRWEAAVKGNRSYPYPEMLRLFNAPASRSPPTEEAFMNQRNPPRWEDVIAFWGNDMYKVMSKKLEQKRGFNK